MFGFVVANAQALTEAQRERYRGCYCGLCRALKARFGELTRLTLNYDMTFLILLLSGMYEPEETADLGRCGLHPLRPRSWWRSGFTDYAADMTVALAYFNCLDDYADEHRRTALVASKLLRRRYEEVRARWPEQCAAIEQALARLGELERAGVADPDAAADCSGALLGALFAVREDPVWNPRLRAFGEALGRLVYMMDACVDLERDRRRGCYNPLLGGDREMDRDEQTEMLKMLAGDCAAAFEALPIVQDADILRNVLYSGIWSQYALAEKKRAKGEKADA